MLLIPWIFIVITTTLVDLAHAVFLFALETVRNINIQFILSCENCVCPIKDQNVKIRASITEVNLFQIILHININNVTEQKNKVKRGFDITFENFNQ